MEPTQALGIPSETQKSFRGRVAVTWASRGYACRPTSTSETELLIGSFGNGLKQGAVLNPSCTAHSPVPITWTWLLFRCFPSNLPNVQLLSIQHGSQQRASCCVVNRSALDHTLAGCGMKEYNVCKLFILSGLCPLPTHTHKLVKSMQATSCNDFFHIQWYWMWHIPYPCHVLIYKYLLRASFLSWGTGGQINCLIKWRQNICGGWKGGRLSLEIFINWLSQSTTNPLPCTSLLHWERRLEWKDNGYVTSMEYTTCERQQGSEMVSLWKETWSLARGLEDAGKVGCPCVRQTQSNKEKEK